ncbi:internal virion protein C, partial [Xylella fastidiosa subsp. multiplex]|nr:internal virion protein C [Xylella fastidiosa subsp. multiplex]
INSALNQEDPRTAWEMLQGIKAELDKVQPDEQMTPQREWLISAQEQVQNQMNAWTKAQAKALDDSMKSMNKLDVIDKQFQKRIN